MADKSTQRRASIIRNLDSMGIMPDQALKMSDKQLQVKFQSYGSSISASTVKAYKRLIDQSITKGSQRRTEIVKESTRIAKTKGFSGVALKEFEKRINFSVNKIESNNKKFTNIVNNLVEQFNMDRDKAIKEAKNLLRVPKQDVKKLIRKGKISKKKMDIIDQWSP